MKNVNFITLFLIFWSLQGSSQLYVTDSGAVADSATNVVYLQVDNQAHLVRYIFQKSDNGIDFEDWRVFAPTPDFRTKAVMLEDALPYDITWYRIIEQTPIQESISPVMEVRAIVKQFSSIATRKLWEGKREKVAMLLQ